MVQHQYLASWVPLFASSVDEERAQAKGPVLMQFSTVSKQGYPSTRSVVFRGFLFDDKSNNVLTFTTDKRMQKYIELLDNDKFEAVVYLPHVRRQFRFRGTAKLLDDTHTPKVDLSRIQPINLVRSNVNSSESDLDSESDSEEDGLNFTPVQSTSLESLNKKPQSVAVGHHLVSPGLIGKLATFTRNENLSFTSLNNISNLTYEPPTDDEWHDEWLRHWNGMSRDLKRSFRRPPPKSDMTDDKQKIIDSIKRGVDGKKDDDGLKNFAVVALFTNYVDYYSTEKDKRIVFEEDEYHLWKEHEVCP